MSSPTLSFGYGTILDHDHWCAWCQERQANPDAISPVESAWLPDRELAFTLRAGIEGGGVLNVRTRLGQVVSGVLFSTSVEGIELLDAKEGHPEYCRAETTTVLTSDGRGHNARVYVAREHTTSTHVAPTLDYAETVRAGLNQFGLSDTVLNAAATNTPQPTAIRHVFVYGTLRKGESRHDVLRLPTLVGDATVATIRGRLVDLGDYPGLVNSDDPQDQVVGEIYEYEELSAILSRLDMVEGFHGWNIEGSLYRRALITARFDAEQVVAWAYYFSGAEENGQRIVSGDWCQRGKVE